MKILPAIPNAVVASLLFFLAGSTRDRYKEFSELSAFINPFNWISGLFRSDRNEAKNESNSTCSYVPPTDDNIQGGHYEGMEDLTAIGWKADTGDASGDADLFYAYGPAIKKEDHVAAWKYNARRKYIQFWWSKSHCKGICSSCCAGRSSNKPGVEDVSMNPSASTRWFRYALTTKFKEGDTVETKFGTFTLKMVREIASPYQGAWKLFRNNSTEFIDHVYWCSESDYSIRYKIIEPEAPESTDTPEMAAHVTPRESEEGSATPESTETPKQEAKESIAASAMASKVDPAILEKRAEAKKSIAESAKSIAESAESIVASMERMRSG